MRLFNIISLFTVFLASASAANMEFSTKSVIECIEVDSWSSCLKHKMLDYLDEQLGTNTEARSLESIDEALLRRTIKYLKSFNYNIDLPFVNANLKYRPNRSLANLDIEFKNNKIATNEARGILKKKLLLPFLLLLKLKLKALMPIFVAIIGLKAMKALVLSKIAILLVVGFIAFQFLKKGGMAPPMGMAMEPAPPAGSYGAPPVPSTTSGYEPPNTWDGNGPYSRVWSPSNGIEAQSLAYNYYAPSSSNSNSYSAPVSTSLTSSSSSSSSSNY